MLSTRRTNQATKMGQQNAHDDFFHTEPWRQVITNYENLRARGTSVVRDTMLRIEDRLAFGELYAKEYLDEVSRLTRAQQQAAPLIRQQALQRFPVSQEASTAQEQELWCGIFATLTRELLALRQKEDPATLDEGSWETIALGCFSPMASALLKEAEAEEQATLAREAKEIEALLAQRKAEKRQLKPSQEVWIWANQGHRLAKVLATVGQQALLEYVMPKGSTALRLVQVDNSDAIIRSVSYRRVPLAFLRVLTENQVEWIGEPQAGHPIGSPAAYLQKRTRMPSLDGQSARPQEPPKLLFRPEGVSGERPVLLGEDEEIASASSFAQNGITLDEVTLAASSEERDDEHASS